MTSGTPKYAISVAASLVGVHPQTLRLYDERGLVRPRRSAGGRRLYSDDDLARLRTVQQLTGEVGLNLAGVEHVLRLEQAIRALQSRVRELEQEREALGAEHRREVAAVRREYRRDVVLWKPPGEPGTGVATRAPRRP